MGLKFGRPELGRLFGNEKLTCTLFLTGNVVWSG